MAKFLKYVTNKYVISVVVFIAIMLFIDENDWFTQRERKQELKEINQSIDFLKREIIDMNKSLDELNHPNSLEKVAREKYFEKRPDEDVFIIKRDSTRNLDKK